MEKKYDVACYHWSNWHRSPDNDKKRGQGWTEWEYLKSAIPRFVGHRQPKIPLWGYLDDTKTETAQMQIDAAADHGITAFIFDWGWRKNDGGGHGNNSALEEGFLQASNREKLQFGLMWCGAVIPEELEELYDYVIQNYFTQPNYWRVDGGLYFSIYEIFKFVKALGGLEAAAASLQKFREKAAALGLGKIHLVAVEWGLQEEHRAVLGDPARAAEILGIDGITSYVWAHNVTPEDGLSGSYKDWAEAAIPYWGQFAEKFSVPYYPHVSMGWDPSPRCPNTMPYKIGGPLMYHTLEGKYEIFHEPYLSSIVKDNTPQEFERALLRARKYLDGADSVKSKVVTLYAWNEWTEGGYLEPESEYGYGYLEAIKNVFGK